MKVLDSTVLIDLLRGKEEVKKIIEKDQYLTTQINIYEVISGLFAKKVTSSKILQAQELFENIRVLPLNDSSTVMAASINGDLISRGEIIEDCDCLTAGIALSHNINIIVTKNKKHFSRIKGIEVETY